MSGVELVLIALGLSMDAFAAALSDGLAMKKRSTAFLAAAIFGFFQAAMPIAGYILGSGFAEIISAWDHIIALAVLGFIGGKMVIESISELRAEKLSPSEVSIPNSGAAVAVTLPMLLAQGIATSIDALIVGVSFAAGGVRIIPAACVIGAITFAVSLAGALGGRRFGLLAGTKAQTVGGIVLIAIGIKTAVQHILG